MSPLVLLIVRLTRLCREGVEGGIGGAKDVRNVPPKKQFGIRVKPQEMVWFADIMVFGGNISGGA